MSRLTSTIVANAAGTDQAAGWPSSTPAHRGLSAVLTEAFSTALDERDGVFLSVDIDVCDPGTHQRPARLSLAA